MVSGIRGIDTGNLFGLSHKALCVFETSFDFSSVAHWPKRPLFRDLLKKPVEHRERHTALAFSCNHEIKRTLWTAT
jgi:hypothetical protein